MSDVEIEDFDFDDFDIHELDDGAEFDVWDREEVFEMYQDTLIRHFEFSERAKALAEKSDDDVGFWASHFLGYGFRHLGVTPPETTSMDAEEIVNDLLPAKVTIFDKEEARWAIPELIEFWHFLEEQYGLEQSGQIIAVLKNAEANFPEMMVDPSRAGMAKSFMLMGQRSGYDMTDPAQQHEAMLAFNDLQRGTLVGDGPGMFDFPMDDYPEDDAGTPQPLSKKQKARKKSKRKQQKASKRKNRKK